MEQERPVMPRCAPTEPMLLICALGWERGAGCVASPISKSIPGFTDSFQLAASADLILMPL